MEQFPRPAPGGLCTQCLDGLYFHRETRTLWCKRCRRRFRWLDHPEWDPHRDRQPVSATRQE